MSQKGSGLARLMGGLKNLDSAADALATRLENALGDMGAEMATTTGIIGNVEQGVNDLRAVNRLYSNGAPADTANPTPPAPSGASSTSSAPSSTPSAAETAALQAVAQAVGQQTANSVDRTAIGPVTR